MDVITKQLLANVLDIIADALGQGIDFLKVPSMSSTEQIYIQLLGLWEVVLPAKMCSL